MQNSNNKLIYLVFIFCSMLFIYLLSMLQPTFDDWTYITKPNYDTEFYKYIVPIGTYWRPFDGLFGYLLSINHKMFPFLNHTIIGLGHIASSLLIYIISKHLDFKKQASLIASIFFFISPAMLGTVLGVDSLNQIYSQLWGLVALFTYIKYNYNNRKNYYLLFSLLATLSKENGIMWFIIIPLIAFTFNFSDKKRLKKELLLSLLFVILYFIIRLILSNYTPEINSEYVEGGVIKYIKNFGKFATLSFFSIDFVSIFYKPYRNVFILILTAVLSLPLYISILFPNIKRINNKQGWGIIIAIILTALPHLLTLFSAMHSYAALGMISLLVAYIIDKKNTEKRITTYCFILYVLSAIIVDTRHYIASYKSGIIGVEMVNETIKQTHKPTVNVYCIDIDKDEKKYSSFCVIPHEAFGWGYSIISKTGGEWPKTISNKEIKEKDKDILPKLINKKIKEGYDHIWIVDGKHVKVIEK